MEFAGIEKYVFRFKKNKRNSSLSDYSEIYFLVCLYFLFIISNSISNIQC